MLSGCLLTRIEELADIENGFQLSNDGNLGGYKSCLKYYAYVVFMK